MELLDVSIGYDRTPILTSTSLRIRPGDRIAVLGASGAGKSTLLSCLAGQLPVMAGRIKYFGPLAQDRRQPLYRPEIAWMAHELALVPDLRAVTNVLHGCLGRLRLPRFGWRTYPRAERAAALHLLEALGLAECAHSTCGQLSRGQQQRVALARILLQHPMLVLLDEPTSVLDPPTAGVVLEVLNAMVSGGGAVVMALHDEKIAEAWATRLLQVVDGRLSRR